MLHACIQMLQFFQTKNLSFNFYCKSSCSKIISLSWGKFVGTNLYLVYYCVMELLFHCLLVIIVIMFLFVVSPISKNKFTEFYKPTLETIATKMFH